MARWANETAYNTLIDAAILKYGSRVTRPLVQAIIAVESAFRPDAFRPEPHLGAGEGSHGLMQVLYQTARGTGWIGQPADLFKPNVNIDVGVHFLSDLVRRKNGDILSAVSAYNNGNGRRATGGEQVCLARDTNKQCIRWFHPQPGDFLNQPYVDKVLDALRYFDPGTTGIPDDDVAGTGSLDMRLIALGGLLWLAFRRR